MPEPAGPGKRFGSQEVLDGFNSLYERWGTTTAKGFEAAAHAFAVAELLIAKGIVGLEELDQRRRAAEDRLQQSYERAGLTVQLATEVTDKYAMGSAAVEIDCAARLPLCRAACCRLRFPLSEQDIDEGVVNWTLAEPYLNRQRADGYCVHCDEHNKACQGLPGSARRVPGLRLSQQLRIWVDFEQRVQPQPPARDRETQASGSGRWCARRTGRSRWRPGLCLTSTTPWSPARHLGHGRRWACGGARRRPCSRRCNARRATRRCRGSSRDGPPTPRRRDPPRCSGVARRRATARTRSGPHMRRSIPRRRHTAGQPEVLCPARRRRDGGPPRARPAGFGPLPDGAAGPSSGATRATRARGGGALGRANALDPATDDRQPGGGRPAHRAPETEPGRGPSGGPTPARRTRDGRRARPDRRPVRGASRCWRRCSTDATGCTRGLTQMR